MTQTICSGGQLPMFPFGQKELEEAKAAFLKSREWAALYDVAPEGARRRLELSFWFSLFGKSDPVDYDRLIRYSDYRDELESRMSVEDLAFLADNIRLIAAAKHYRELVEARSNPQSKYMTYDQFYKFLRDQGKYDCPHYADDTKRGIIGDFEPVLTRAHDPLAAFIEDILATAELREVRTFPKEEWMYVRVAVRFLNKDAEWGKPFQIVALWDCFKKLQGYTFVATPTATEHHPEEVGDEETEAQRAIRQKLRESRIAKSAKEESMRAGSKKAAASGKLSKEDVEWLQGQAFDECEPNPHETPGLAEALDKCQREHPMTWEEAHRNSVLLHKSCREDRIKNLARFLQDNPQWRNEYDNRSRCAKHMLAVNFARAFPGEFGTSVLPGIDESEAMEALHRLVYPLLNESDLDSLINGTYSKVTSDVLKRMKDDYIVWKSNQEGQQTSAELHIDGEQGTRQST